MLGATVQGQLLDGTVIAVKQLSSKSKQGNREFLNEIGMILVYEYMENNSLARALFGEYYAILFSCGYY